jgi:hypothetical protein
MALPIHTPWLWNQDTQPNKRDIHLTEIEYNIDTSPTQRAGKAGEQHRLLMPHLLNTAKPITPSC